MVNARFKLIDNICMEELAMTKKNILILAQDDYNFRQYQSVQNVENYRFTELLTHKEIYAEDRNLNEMIDLANFRMDNFDGRIDGVVSPWDFPCSFLVPYLKNRYHLPSPSMEAYFKCEHKYWSRLEQRKVTSEHIPLFSAVNPFEENVEVELSYPFWIKPIKSFQSHLGFYISNEKDLVSALKIIRKKIPQIGKPFNEALQHCPLPKEIEHIDGMYCIAEEIIQLPQQVTIEGYVFNGQCESYAFFDSLREPGKSTFSGYFYPSFLSGDMKEELSRFTRKIIKQLGLDNTTFNMEYFLDEKTGEFYLLEINVRSSQSHSEIFRKRHGFPINQIAINILENKKPSFTFRGDFDYAAKFFIRSEKEGRVASIPNRSDLLKIQHKYPDAVVDLQVRDGMMLEDMDFQDSYSFELAQIHIGGSTKDEVHSKFEGIKNQLNFKIEDNHATGESTI